MAAGGIVRVAQSGAEGGGPG
jgi:hypothetical protein